MPKSRPTAPSRQSVSRSRIAGLVVSALAVGLAANCGSATKAAAQGKLDARYAVTLAGVPLGKGAWIIDIAEERYTAAASGATSGLLQYFTGGHGSSASRGAVQRGGLLPQSYASNVQTARWTEDIRIDLAAGRVKEYAVMPPNPAHPDRVEVTEAHRRGVSDPMSAALVTVAGNSDLLGPEACDRRVSVFDGRMRYDIELVFKRTEEIKAQKGYQGLVVVCTALFNPIAGHVPDRPTVKYLVARRDIEVWLAPIAGTRVLVPFRIQIPTPLGEGVLQATQFVTTPQPGRLAPVRAGAN